MAENSCFWRIFSLVELGGTPPPLTENHSAQKPLAELGGTPPLTEKSAKTFLKASLRPLIVEIYRKPVSTNGLTLSLSVSNNPKIAWYYFDFAVGI